MIEIILTVCAIANPSNCEEKYLQFTFDGSIQQCMMAAQPYIAQWIGNHPEWMATKWSCDYPGHEKRRILASASLILNSVRRLRPRAIRQPELI